LLNISLFAATVKKNLNMIAGQKKSPFKDRSVTTNIILKKSYGKWTGGRKKTAPEFFERGKRETKRIVKSKVKL
jgi:hypothetical protein